MTRVRQVGPDDRAEWDQLYAGYAQFYNVSQSPAMRDVTWDWLMDDAHSSTGYIATDANGALIGLTHIRPFARPLSATTGGFLDDLYVDPQARGQGVSQALIAAVKRHGAAQGWSVIRWITAADNAEARRVYDKIATQTAWVTYDIALT